MKKRKMINLRSCVGFTMYDLIAAILIIMLFTGVIGTLSINALKANYKIKLTEVATNYAIQILEDIDKIPYDQVKNGMESNYIEKLSIPDSFNVLIEVKHYNEGNNKEDILKQVKLTITHEFLKESEKFVVNHLKVKEI